MFRRTWEWNKDQVGYFWPFLLVYVAVKITQSVLYPTPYIMSDSAEYLETARTLLTNPYKPIGYSLFLAAARPLLFTPLCLTILHSALKLAACLILGLVLRRYYKFPRAWNLAVCALITLNPTALLVDHFLLSDSLFISCTIGLLAFLLAYIKCRTWLLLLVTMLLALAATTIRFVGISYPALVLLVVILYGGRHKGPQVAVLLVATVILLVGVAMRNNKDLGCFKLTTFDGWAFHGTIGPLLHRYPINVSRIEDPETAVVCDYLMTFPLDKYQGRQRGFFRWHPESPAKQLLGTFRPIRSRPVGIKAVRDSTFLFRFTGLARNPTTSAQRLYHQYRNKTNPDYPPYTMEYWSAFVVTNELLRKSNGEFMRQHRMDYLTGFFPSSLRLFFVPSEPPMARGKYKRREHPDKSIAAFWPGEDSSRWKPRYADVGAYFSWSHQVFVISAWVFFILSLFRAWTHLRAKQFLWRDLLLSIGALCITFALASGALVAYSHMMEIRYTTPILPFVVISSAFFCLSPCAPRAEDLPDSS